MPQSIRIGLIAILLFTAPTMSQGADPAESAFMDAKMKMRDSMPIDYKGDPDVEFVRSLIYQQQGEIDLAEVELRYGDDPQVRALAEEIIKGHKAQIQRLNDWLAQRKQ